MIENRQYQRRAFSVEITLHSDDNFYAGITGDVSEGGIFVATYVPPPLGATVSIEVALPDGTPIKASGVVKWVRDLKAARDCSPGCGVQFTEIDATALDAIRRFVTDKRDTILYEDAA